MKKALTVLVVFALLLSLGACGGAPSSSSSSSVGQKIAAFTPEELSITEQDIQELLFYTMWYGLDFVVEMVAAQDDFYNDLDLPTALVTALILGYAPTSPEYMADPMLMKVPVEVIDQYAYRLYGVMLERVDFASVDDPDLFAINVDYPGYYALQTGFGDNGEHIYENETLTIQQDGAVIYTCDYLQGWAGESEYQGTYVLSFQLMRDGEEVFLRLQECTKDS